MIPQSTINACVKAWYGSNEDTDYGKIQAVLLAYESMRARTTQPEPPTPGAGRVEGEQAAYERWFDGEQGKAYDGMKAFARAAWMERATKATDAAAVFASMMAAPYGDTTAGDIVCAETTRNRLESAWLPIIAAAIGTHPAPARAVDDASRALVARLRMIHTHPDYEAVWFCAQNHIGAYAGPKYDKELSALEAALGGEGGGG